MKVTSQTLPKSQVELTIELSVEEVQPYVEKAAKRIAQDVDIKGFRKGKVPYDVLKQNVGEATIYEEAFNDIVEETYKQAIEQEKLIVVGRANIDLEKIAPGNPVVYKATVPLLPKLTLGDYKNLKAKKENVKLDEKKLKKTITDLRRMRAKEKLVNREAKKGDKVELDFEVKVGGVVIEGGKAEKQSLTVGEEKFIPGFEDEVLGMQKGEEKDFELHFPKDYKKGLAGKKANFHVKVHEVYEVELPELNEEFAKELNFDSVKHLTGEIEKNIMRELEEEAQQKFELAALEEIAEKSEIAELPDQLLDEEVEKMIAELKHDTGQQGVKFEDYLTHLGKGEADLRKDMRKSAEKRIVAAIIMREIATVENITVSAADVDKELVELKKLYEQLPEAMAQIDSPAQRTRIENRLIHQKTFEAVEKFTKA